MGAASPRHEAGGGAGRGSGAVPGTSGAGACAVSDGAAGSHRRRAPPVLLGTTATGPDL